MRILTLENTPYDLDTLPDEVNDLRFAVLDNSDPANPYQGQLRLAATGRTVAQAAFWHRAGAADAAGGAR